MPQPSGTVTFLFTDIEGSTRLWEEHPEAMRVALARHDELLRHAIESNQGYVFKTQGDAFCAAFVTASDAINAAIASQLLLHNEVWQQTGPLYVRMALHTGESHERDGDYFGPTLNRVARLQATASGQQTLLSQITYTLIRDSLPPYVSVQDLGTHRLKDLQRSERIYQLNHSALPDTFAPIKSLDNPKTPNNLPQQVTSFIGREKEIEAVKSLLVTARLLTLIGSGGCGKTRLGLQVAAEVLENYKDGVWLVELAPVTDPTLVPQTVAQVLCLNEEAGKALVQTLVKSLKDKKMLLVLDNCEHVLEACAQLVNTLIRACPNLTILASSREGLCVTGEQNYRIPSLSLPTAPLVQTVESVSRYEAARLFIERASAALPTFLVTKTNVSALTQLCVRLDGIPLAIELSAARVSSLTVEEINSKLGNCFHLLTGGSRTALPRQQTLRALIDWSYDLLNVQEKTLLSRLSVFTGGWTLEAAEQVGAGEGIDDWQVLDLHISLVNKSLVEYDGRGTKGRYRLLATIRQYSAEIFENHIERDAVLRRRYDYYASLVQKADQNRNTPGALDSVRKLEEEHDNIHTVLTWCLNSRRADAGLQMGLGLCHFWARCGYQSYGKAILRDLMAHSAASQQSRDAVYLRMAILDFFDSEDQDAIAVIEEILLRREAINDRKGVAECTGLLGKWAAYRLEWSEACNYLRRSLELHKELGNPADIGWAYTMLARMVPQQEEAKQMFREALQLFQSILNYEGIGWNAYFLAYWMEREQEASYSEQISELLDRSYEAFQIQGDIVGIIKVRLLASKQAHNHNDFKRARQYYEECRALVQNKETSDRQFSPDLLQAIEIGFEETRHIASD